MNRLLVFGLSFFSAFAHTLPAELNRFALIPDPESYPRGVEISRRYEVLVKTADDATPWDTALHRTTTYRLWPDYLDPETLPAKHSQTAVHIAQVDTDVRLRVRVQIIDGVYGRVWRPHNHIPTHCSGVGPIRSKYCERQQSLRSGSRLGEQPHRQLSQLQRSRESG